MKKLNVLAIVLSVSLLFCGCEYKAKADNGPGAFAVGSGITVGRDFVTFIGEVFDDAQGTIIKDFPLPEKIHIDSLNGTISYYRLNGHCSENNIATVGFLNGDGGALLIWDFQDTVNAPISVSYPGGVEVSSLHFQSYNDLCTPTNFRLAITMHRVNETDK